MVQMKVVVVALSVVLVGGWAFAQQQGQQGSSQQQYGSQQSGGSIGGAEQRSGQSGSSIGGTEQRSGQTSGGSALGGQQGSQLGSGGAQQRLQQLSQAIEKSDAELSKAVDKVKKEAKDGQVIGAALVQKQAGSPDQGVSAHVYVLSNNQIQRYTVDPKNDNVQDTQNVQTLSSPWQQRISEMRGGQGTGGQAGMGTLNSSQAQQLGQQVQQANLDLSKAIDKAKEQVDQGKVIGVFAVRPEHASPQAQQAAGAQANVFTKVFVLDQNDQLHVVTVDAKGDKVLHSDRLQNLGSPWQSRSGMGGSQQPGQQHSSPSPSPRAQPDAGSDGSMGD